MQLEELTGNSDRLETAKRLMEEEKEITRAELRAWKHIKGELEQNGDRKGTEIGQLIKEKLHETPGYKEEHGDETWQEIVKAELGEDNAQVILANKDQKASPPLQQAILSQIELRKEEYRSYMKLLNQEVDSIKSYRQDIKSDILPLIARIEENPASSPAYVQWAVKQSLDRMAEERQEELENIQKELSGPNSTLRELHSFLPAYHDLDTEDPILALTVDIRQYIEELDVERGHTPSHKHGVESFYT